MKAVTFTLAIITGEGENQRIIHLQFGGIITPSVKPADKDIVATALWQIEQIVNSNVKHQHLRLHLTAQ